MRYIQNRGLRQLKAGSFALTCMGMLSTTPFSAQALEAEKEKTKDTKITVVDGEGNPISGAEVTAKLMIRNHEMPAQSLYTNDEGIVHFDKSASPLLKMAESMTLYASAKGYGFGKQSTALPDDDGKVSITLEKGLEYIVEISNPAGGAISDEEQLIVTVQDFVHSNIPRYLEFENYPGQINLFNPEKISSSEFKITVPADTDPLYFVYSNPGQVYNLRANGVTLDDFEEGRYTMTIPETGKVSASFEITDEQREEFGIGESNILLSRTIETRGTDGGSKGAMVGVISERSTSAESINAEWDHLAPGSYSISFSAGEKGRVWDRQSYSHFSESKSIELKAGDHETVTVKYDKKSPKDFKGEGKAKITFVRRSGEPAEGANYEITYYDEKSRLRVPIDGGRVPSDGVIELDELKVGDGHKFLIKVDRKNLADFKVLDASEIYTQSVELPPGEGDQMVDLTLVSMNTGDVKSLSEHKGKVIFLEFWATWCGPCQDPMAKNQKILEERSADWGDKAEIVAVSIDNDMSTLKAHVADKGWDAVTHYWAEEGGPGWGSDAVKAYGVSGVPTALLINQAGEITWRGHPASIDVEAEMDKLLEDRTASIP